MTRLEGNAKLKRTLRVPGIEGDCVATISASGIAIRIKKSRQGVNATWPELVRACQTPEGVPSKFLGKPHEFLMHAAQQCARRTAKRLEAQLKAEMRAKRSA